MVRLVFLPGSEQGFGHILGALKYESIKISLFLLSFLSISRYQVSFRLEFQVSTYTTANAALTF